jgi:integrase/recombinase XerD
MSQTDHIDWFIRRWKAFDANEDTSETTYETRRGQLERFRDWYGADLATVTGEDIEDFITEKSVGEGYAPTTLSGYRWALSKFYRFMEQADRVDRDPLDDVQLKDMGAVKNTPQKKLKADDGERINPLTRDEVDALIDNVPDPKIRNELLIRLMVQTGMRAGEVAKLKLDDVDTDSREIKIRETISKSQGRTVVYQPSLSFLMDQWLNGGHRDAYSSVDDSGYLFVTRKSDRMTNNLINDKVKQAAENGGIQKVLYEDARGQKRYRVTSHTLRHTFAVFALKPDVGEGTMNLAYLREVMGHTDIEVTQVYLDYLQHDSLDSMRKHGPSV